MIDAAPAVMVFLVTPVAADAAALAFGTDVQALTAPRTRHLVRPDAPAPPRRRIGRGRQYRASRDNARSKTPSSAADPVPALRLAAAAASHTWACACLHAWNTFDTGGVCPACQRQWLETQCPQCDTWSPAPRLVSRRRHVSDSQ